MSQPDFPTAIDSSMRATFVQCPMKFYRQYMQHLVPNGRSNLHLVAGGAFAKGLKMMRRHYFAARGSEEEAIHYGMVALTEAWGTEEDDETNPKTYANTLGALVSYFDEYGLEHDLLQPVMTESGPAVEFSFAIPLDETKHPQTGEPIIYFGRADMVGEFGKNGPIFIDDEKLTSRLGPTWPAQWDLRAQMTGYTWAARRHGIKAEGAIVRGISVLKHTYGHAQVGPLYRPQFAIDRWYTQLIRDVNRMITCWNEGYWDFNFDMACAMFRPCQFMTLCGSEYPEQWIGNFNVGKVWNPLGEDDND